MRRPSECVTVAALRRAAWLFGAALALLGSVAPPTASAQESPVDAPGARGAVPAELARRIDDAIDRGVAFLSGRQGEEGGWPLGTGLDGVVPPLNSTGGRLMFEGVLGRTARAADALLDAGLPASDPRIVRAAAWIEAGIDRLEKAPTPAFRFVEYTSSVLRLRLRLGLVDDRSRALCGLIARSRTSDDLFCAVISEPAAANQPGWAPTTCDAMSALALARDGGIPLEDDLCRRLRRAIVGGQTKDGGWSRNPGYRPMQAGGLAGTTSEWMRPTFGGTTATLAAYLFAGDPGITLDSRRSDEVVVRGLAWLARQFEGLRGDFQRIGGSMRLRYSDRFYFDLLALAQVGVLLDLEEWNGLRWYECGATELLSLQGKHGEWRHHDPEGTRPQAGIALETVDDNTALAISFLARGRARRGATATPAGAAVASGSTLLDLDWAAAARLGSRDREAFFAAAFPLLAQLPEAAWEKEAKRFAALGTEVLPPLVERLGAEGELDRRCALAALRSLLGETLDFDPRGDAEARARGLREWRRWLGVAAPVLVREGDGFVVRSGGPKAASDPPPTSGE